MVENPDKHLDIPEVLATWRDADPKGSVAQSLAAILDESSPTIVYKIGAIQLDKCVQVLQEGLDPWATFVRVRDSGADLDYAEVCATWWMYHRP